MTKKELLKKLVPTFVLDFYHQGMAFLGALVYRFPSKKIIVIGVTGTSGKSTTVDFITRILEEAGNKVTSTSSVRFKIADKEWKNKMKMTMPGRFVIQKFLKQAVDAQCKYAVLEVTSEGIKQHRHQFINFNTAVFNNLSPEHIESHGGFENYRNEKLKLFKVTKNIHVVNSDDENAKYFLDIPAQKTITFGRETGDVNLKNTEFKLNILGEFNKYNALAAIAVATSQGISLDVCRQALAKVIGIPGRMQIVAKEPNLVVVDYAHTPEQLEQAYKSLPKPLVCVLGSCGGGRDKWKRPELGKLARQYCKEIIITNEDPYDEDPWEIMEAVAAGVESRDEEPAKYHLILDRREAIQKALVLAQPGDTVIITGKGSEPLMCLANGVKIPWDDAAIVKEEMAK